MCIKTAGGRAPPPMHASNCQTRHSRSSTAGTGANAFSMAAVTSALISAGGKCVCMSDPLRDKVKPRGVRNPVPYRRRTFVGGDQGGPVAGVGT